MSDAAEIAMFESGWFGQSSAFWRWVKTPEAKPYVDAFTDMHRRPAAAEPYDLLGEEDTPDILDPDHLKKLARDIEIRFAGDGD
jgi:hypothetical protein